MFVIKNLVKPIQRKHFSSSSRLEMVLFDVQNLKKKTRSFLVENMSSPTISAIITVPGIHNYVCAEIFIIMVIIGRYEFGSS